MKSALHGKSTSAVEITNVSSHGFWLMLGRRELFLSFDLFPWFRQASIGELGNVERPRPGHLWWPDLDIDLAEESIEHPERFPLVSHSPPKKRMQPARRRRTRSIARRSARG
jgi:hypothetical protein